MSRIPNALPIILIIAIVGIGGYVAVTNSGGAGINFSVFNQSFSPVFCNQYDWMSCNYHVDSTQQATVSHELFSAEVKFTCQSDRCDVTGATGNGANSLQKNGQAVSSPFSLNRNDVASVTGYSAVLTYNVVNQRLVWCGGAACDAAVSGSPVIGANGCAFVTDKTIYSTSGGILRQPTSAGTSYTIPATTSAMVWTGAQFICGNQYAECSVNADCRAGHTYTYNVGGQLLGAEAQGGQLQVYGCVNQGSAPTSGQLDYVPSIESKPGGTAFNYGNRCQVIQSQTVQCLPGSTSCGANAVCDVSTFTCKQTGSVSCSNDAQCGVGQVYDQATKTFYHFSCANAGTVSSSCQRVTDRGPVECAYNSECPTNWFCDTDNKCKQAAAVKTQCPIACCQNDPRYFDKPAPPGNVCCPGGNSYAPTLAQCGQSPTPGSGWTPSGFDLLGIAVLVIAIIVVVIIVIKKRSR